MELLQVAQRSSRSSRRLSDLVHRACEDLAGLDGRETPLTGGEPFLVPERPELAGAAARWTRVTILTIAMVFARGSRRRALDSLHRTPVTLQVSLDFATFEVHDPHRGAGSFARPAPGSTRWPEPTLGS